MAYPTVVAAPTPPVTLVEDVPLQAADHLRTARVLQRALDCDVAALLAVNHGRVSLLVVSHQGAAGRTEAWCAVGDLHLSLLAAQLPRQSDVALRWPRGLDVAPPGEPPLRCQLVVPLVFEEHERSAWLIGRAAQEFSDEDVEHAALLAPGLRLQLDPPAGQEVPSTLLTCRERDVLALVARGLTARAVAHRFSISERTVQKHLEHIYGKLGCRDRLTAVLRARDEGLLTA